jgi:hypothetical protein
MVGPCGSEIPGFNPFLDPRYRDIFDLRPDLLNIGVTKNEVDRILGDREVFHGINKVLDMYVKYRS